jgi:hypothetical protein
MLRRAIRSVLNQTFRDFRVCVYDNASGDETAAVVEEFRSKDSRVEYFCRTGNIGAHDNFVDGANRVETPFFSFLSDDDIMLPNLYESTLAGFRRYPEAALSTLATVRMRPNGMIMHVWLRQWPEGLIVPPNGVLSILRHGDPGLQSLLIRKDVWEKFGGFDELTEPCADVDFQLRIAACLPIVVSRKIGAIGIIHPDSTTVSTEFKAVWPGLRRLADKFNQDTTLPTDVRQRAAAMLALGMKRSLLTQGVARYISRGKWEEAEWAADTLVQESGGASAARIIRGATAICRRLPSTRFLVRALFVLRASVRTMLNLDVQWRYRMHSRFLKTCTVAASSENLTSAALSASENDKIARRVHHSPSAGKLLS